jgi:hypothetical protein
MSFLRRFMLSLLAVSAAYLAGILLINPRGEFTSERFPWVRTNSRRVKLELYRKYASEKPVTILLFGSSRTMLIEPRDVDFVTGMRSFNFGVFSASPEDYLALYRWMHRRRYIPQILVVGLDPESLGSKEREFAELYDNPELGREVFPRTPLRAFIHRLTLYKNTFRLYYAKDAIRSMKLSVWPEVPYNRFRPDGTLDFVRWDLEIARGTFKRVKPADCEWLVRDLKTESLSPDRVDYLRSLLQEAHSDGVHVIVWLTPNYPNVFRQLMADRGSAYRLESVRKLLESLAPSVEATFVDLSDPRSFAGDPGNWYDCVHSHHADGAKIVQRLLGAEGRESSAMR